MRTVRITAFTAALLLSSKLVSASIVYDDFLYVAYPAASFDFDIWNNSQFDYLNWSAISSSGSAQAVGSMPSQWSDSLPVPVNSTAIVQNNGNFWYFGPEMCVEMLNAAYDLEGQEVVHGYGVDCYSYH